MFVARRKRSVDVELVRSKRQVQDECEADADSEDWDVCASIIDASTSDPKSDVCDGAAVKSLCCNYCNFVRQEEEGKSTSDNKHDLPAPSQRVELQPAAKESQPKRLMDIFSYYFGLN